MRIALFLLVSFLVACGSKSAPAPAQPAPAPEPAPAVAEAPPAPTISDAELDQLLRDMVAMVGKMADAATAANGDCGGVAAGIDGVVAEHAQLLEKIKSVENDPDVDKRAEAWMTAHEAEMAPAFDKMMNAVMPCAEDERVRKSLDAISAS